MRASWIDCAPCYQILKAHMWGHCSKGSVFEGGCKQSAVQCQCPVKRSRDSPEHEPWHARKRTSKHRCAMRLCLSVFQASAVQLLRRTRPQHVTLATLHCGRPGVHQLHATCIRGLHIVFSAVRVSTRTCACAGVPVAESHAGCVPGRMISNINILQTFCTGAFAED